MMPRTDRRWALVIVGALLVILVVRLLLNNPSRLGLGLLAIGPIILAAYCFSFRGAVLAAAGGTAVFVLSSHDLSGSDLAIAASMRALVFFGSGLIIADLLRRTAEQAALITAQRGELDELQVLREALTPASVPATPGLEVATAYVAAEDQVAGDFFLVMPGDAGRVLLAVGDAVGHGVTAARRAAYVRAVLATLASSSHDPARLLELANTALLETDPTALDFITVLCASVTPDRVTWASAGHPPPWDLDTGHPLAGLEPHEPLGVVARKQYESMAVDLQPGKGVLLFSDGLPEARRAGRSGLFGEDAARRELLAHAGESPAAVVRALKEAACGFAGGHLADDLCLLAARRA